MTSLSPDTVISLVIGVLTLAVAVLTWWETRRSRLRMVDPGSNLFDIIVFQYPPATTRPPAARLRNTGQTIEMQEIGADYNENMRPQRMSQVEEPVV